MKLSFYLRFRRFAPHQAGSFLGLALFLSLGALSCGDAAKEATSNSQKSPQGSVISVFAVDGLLTPYVPVAKEDLIARYIDKLRHGSRTGLRFAKEALGKYGEAAVPAILAGLQVELEKGNAAAANFLAALSYTKTKQTHPILLEVLSRHPLPLVRSQALDTISILGQVELLPGVLVHAKIEAESGPMSRLLPCLGELGGIESAQYLASILEDWLQGEGARGRGATAWDNLLLIEGDSGLDSIALLVDRMPMVLKSTGMIRLLEGGRTEWQDKVRGLLDFRTTPSGSLRRKAVSSLAKMGDWEGVMEASDDPDMQVRIAVIDALRLPDAEVTDAALAFLHQSASNPSEDAAYPALRALLERGESSHLEPWLAQVKGYPTRAGSINALKLFLQPGITHPRLVPMLISRWSYCEKDFRIDIGRVLAQHQCPDSIRFLEKVILDAEEDADVRLYTISSLGNSGAECIPSLFRIWEKQPSPTATDRLFGAMLRYPEDPRVRDFCFELIQDPGSPDGARAMMLTSLPLGFREDAYPGLVAAMQGTEREDIRVFIQKILHEYF